MKVVYAARCEFGQTDDDFRAASAEVWEWAKRYGESPSDISEGGDEGQLLFDNSHQISWRSLQARTMRVFRLIHDAPSAAAAPGWSTHIWVCDDGKHVWGVVRSGPVMTPGVLAPLHYQAGVPRIIHNWIDSIGAHRDLRPLSNGALSVGQNDVDDLVELVQFDGRELPVVAISVAPNGPWFKPVADYKRIARDLAGNAHVYVLDRTASWNITQRLGKELSVYDGAVRIWWPKFGVGDDPYRHPLLVAHRFALSDGRTESDLVRRIWRVAVDVFGSPALESELLSARRRANADELRSELDRVRAAASTQSEYDEIWEQFEATNDALTTEVNELQDRNTELLAELDDIRDDLALARADTNEDNESVWEVSTVEQAVRLAAEECPNIIFLKSAYDSANESQYPSPQQTLEDLRAIGRVATKWANDALAGGFREAFAQEPVRFQPDIGQIAATRFASDYTIDYGGKRVTMGPHLRRGVGSPTEILRIYWYADSEQRQIVVGHVGRKLRDVSNQ